MAEGEAIDEKSAHCAVRQKLLKGGALMMKTPAGIGLCADELALKLYLLVLYDVVMYLVFHTGLACSRDK